MTVYHFHVENEVWFEITDAAMEAMRQCEYYEGASDEHMIDQLFVRRFVHKEPLTEIVSNGTDTKISDDEATWTRMRGWDTTIIDDAQSTIGSAQTDTLSSSGNDK